MCEQIAVMDMLFFTQNTSNSAWYTMKYISSRGLESGLTFEQVLFSGYAKDGGLYFPERIPKLSEETLNEWKNLSYPDIVKNVMGMFIGEKDIPQD